MAYVPIRKYGNNILLFQSVTAVLTNWNPAGAGNNDIDVGSYCPAGAKIAIVRIRFMATSANKNVSIRSIDDNMVFAYGITQVANQAITLSQCFVPIDSSGNIRINANHADISDVDVHLVGCVM